MKLAELVAKMKSNNVSLPEIGTGRGGAIVARDLETALGDHFFARKYANDPVRRKHCELRRAITPMKSYRYNNLNKAAQEFVLKDHNDWIAEEKHNGWRIVVTYVPESGFCFWSGNISDVDFLPKDYTDHVHLPNGLHPLSKQFQHLSMCAFVLDSEGLCFGEVVTKEGLPANNTLEAVGAVLGSDADRAIELQKLGAELNFVCFDMITQDSNGDLSTHKPLNRRMIDLDIMFGNIDLQGIPLSRASQIYANKTTFLRAIWKRGGEGVILKNVNQSYLSGSRLKSHSIKVKRTMSGEIGDDLDAFISGYIVTPEYLKKGVIGGIELSVYVEDEGKLKPHHIATVSGIPDNIREEFTELSEATGLPQLKKEFYNQVLVVDGQELSSRNRRIMHAKVDWNTGFRSDKRATECVLVREELTEERF